ncbi:hypothetical protein N2152v2_002283 [Parachlorella kessleri]
MRRAVRKLHAGSLGKPLGFCRLAPLLTVMALSMLYCFKLQMQSSLVTSRLRISISSSDLPYTWQELRAAAAAKQCRGPEPDEVVPDLVAVRQWHSCKPRQQESITIVTQLSLERLEMLENQCSTWPDPIAAVVYIPTLQGRIFSLDDLTLNGTHLGAAVTRVGQFVERMQQHASCVLDVELATQDFGEGAEAALYPVNAVRNRALMLARTQALLLLDADFVASPTMLAPYKTPQGYAELLQRLDRPEAIVLPAFETASEGYSGKTLALKAARKGKAVAVKKYRNGRMRGFKQHLFVAGHRQTNYTRWVSQDENYKIKYKKMLYFYSAYKQTAGTTFTRISLSLTSEVRYTFTDQGPADHVLKALVYVPTLKGKIFSDDISLNGSHLGVALERLADFHQRMELSGSCLLDLELAASNFYKPGDASLYPVNAARNRALMLARTEALLLLDADFVPTPTMLPEYKSPQGYARLLNRLNKPGAIVLPAFETANNGTEGRVLALEAARRGKDFAVQAFNEEKLLGFAMKEYERGHRATNYDKWMGASQPYRIQYAEGYEPYIIVSRSFVPWYDERFRGYRKNKVQHLLHLAGLNVTFSVHSSGFVVHVPHKKSATYWATRASGEWYKLRVLYESIQEEIAKRQFLPVVSFPHLCVR